MYEEFVKKVNKLEQESELAECLYSKALEMIHEVQGDLRKIDDTRHVRRVIRPFLTQWGMMGRVVGRKDADWQRLGGVLRSLEGEFQKLRGKKLFTTNLEDQEISSAVKTIYGKLRDIRYLGSPTTISKVLHLLNPELFVMWDKDIREKYRRKNHLVRDTPEGYLEFLKEVKKFLEEVLIEYQKATGKGLDEIDSELRSNYKKTLSKLVDEYNWVEAHWKD